MARKNKKSKKHRSFFKAIKPIIRDNRVLYSLLGSLGAGFALGAALNTEKAGILVDKLTSVVKELRPLPEKASKKTKSPKMAQQLKPAKPTKSNKLKALGTS